MQDTKYILVDKKGDALRDGWCRLMVWSDEESAKDWAKDSGLGKYYSPEPFTGYDEFDVMM